MSVKAGVERELARLPEDLRDSGIAAVALAMAARIDEGRGSPSECGKVVLDALSKLREFAPTEEKKGLVHDIRSARRGRLRVAGGTDTED